MAEAGDEATKKFEQGDASTDISEGPIKSRHCTDILCLPLLFACWLAFILVTVVGAKDGSPKKLISPRDYQGAYCGVDKQWNNGPNLEAYKKLSYMMNVSSTANAVMKQLVCSSAASNVLTGGSNPLLTTQALRDEYLCNCCLIPCARCTGSLTVGGDLSLDNVGATIRSRMTELTNVASPSTLFSTSGANGDFFSKMWNEASKYFYKVCVPDCSVDYTTLNASSAPRSYVYTPAPDDPLKSVWDLLLTSANAPPKLKSAFSNFTFKALPESQCPYAASYCVPFPGVKFQEQYSSGYCTFQMSAEVINMVGSAASSTFQSLGGTALLQSASGSFGLWVGDFQKSVDAFVLTGVFAFVVGLVFLVILRFTVGICVWLALLVILFSFAFGGAVIHVRSFQCADTSVFNTMKEAGVSVAVAGSVAASNVMSGGQPVSEAMTGNGADYRGVQRFTRSGRTCQNWATSSPQAAALEYNTSNYPNAGLEKNYCRNPYQASDLNKASSIWCFTTDSETRWELCSPVGVIRPACANGYAVNSESSRKALEVASYVLWALGGVFLIICLIFISRIRLAIAINKVAATFIGHNPLIVLVPLCQAILSIVWQLLWFLSASFLLSQVPDSYTPTGSYRTYAEAYGTDDTPGACTNKWPTGMVWKDEANCVVTNTTGCWKCAPPRFAFDARVCYSFFSFLWTNELMVASGQLLIAGAVGIWFFTPNEEKGKRGVIRPSLYNLFRYHFGSVAFGSLIVAIVQFIRYWLMYLQKQAEAQKNRVMMIITRILICFVWCFEKCLKFLNKNAYIQIALLGTNFCTSAKKAFYLILRNAARFGTFAVLGSVIHAIGRFFIMTGTTVVGYFILRAMHPEVPPIVPLILYTIMGWVVGCIYMNVFGLAVDTSLQCFLAAEEMSIGGSFVPGPLKKLLKPSKSDEGDDA